MTFAGGSYLGPGPPAGLSYPCAGSHGHVASSAPAPRPCTYSDKPIDPTSDISPNPESGVLIQLLIPILLLLMLLLLLLLLILLLLPTSACSTPPLTTTLIPTNPP